MGIPRHHHSGSNGFLAAAAAQMDRFIKTAKAMIKPLRKRHLQIWTAWAVLLPAGILLAWFSIPQQQPVKLLQSPSMELLPGIVQTKDQPGYTVGIRSNTEHTSWQLEWKNKMALQFPSAVIYKVDDFTADPAKGELIGRIEARGDYVFGLNRGEQTALRFLLYDFIHHKTIDTISFENISPPGGGRREP